MSRLEVLIAAMHQKDDSIFERTNIHSDALLINQCDHLDQIEQNSAYGKNRIICTTDRGLSKSRNMALQNAVGDICLICDDDEHLLDIYPELILSEYENNPDADIICFQVEREGKQYSDKAFKVGFLRSLKIASWQLTFRRESILKSGIRFDENFGSGTPRGSGEENIFMFDCLRAHLKIIYVPVCIGKVAQTKSNWFHGFDEKYFFNRGQVIKRLLGSGLGSIYCLYFALTKYKNYKSNISMKRAINMLFRGMREKL